MATKEAPKPRVEGTAAAVRKRNQAIAAAQSFSREGFINQRRSQRSVRAHTLFVGNLDLRATEHTVLQLFKPFGKVKDLDFKFHTGGARRGEPKGFCFVEMATAAAARAAKGEMNGVTIGRRRVVVNWVHDDIAFTNAASRDGAGGGGGGGAKEYGFELFEDDAEKAKRHAQALEVKAEGGESVEALDRKIQTIKAAIAGADAEFEKKRGGGGGEKQKEDEEERQEGSSSSSSASNGAGTAGGARGSDDEPASKRARR